ncbi:MAG: tetratricopeptide repeat protein [Desulfobacteraceae bacterium]
MNRRAVPAAAAFLAAWLFTLFSGASTPVQAGNRALALRFLQQDALTRCVIRFEKTPTFRLMPLEEDALLLVIEEAEGSEAFRKDLSEAGPGLALEQGMAISGIGLRLTLPGPVEELSVACLREATGGIYLECRHRKSTGNQEMDGSKATALHGVHFGFADMRTRMAIGLDGPVSWELIHHDPGRIRLWFPSVRADVEQTRYGPANNLALAELLPNERGVNLSVQLRTHIDRVRLFWVNDRTRLVADLFEGEPIPDVQEAIRSASVEDDRDEQKTSVPPPGLEASSLSKRENPEKTREDTAIPMPQQEAGPVVRGRIVQNALPREGVPDPSAPDTVRNEPSEALSEKDLLREVDPDQALLYGELRQALDSKKPEQAADLCSQFLERYPGSPLDEKVCFLRGDAEFARIRDGKKDRFSPMMKAYQSAISRFRKSPRVQGAYLNMARASSLVGNDYAAIGYLNIVLHGITDPETRVQALLDRGHVYLGIHQPEKAIEDFKTVLAQYPNSPHTPEAELGLARYLQNVGLHKKAEAKMAELLEKHPGFYLEHPEVFFFRGQNALYLKEYDIARASYLRALNIGGQPESADLLLARIGDTYHHASMPREAESIYRTVIREYPDGEGASIAKLRLAGYESGYEGFQALRDANPDKPVADLAVLEMARKYYEEALFSKALEALSSLMDKPFKNEIILEANRLYFHAAEQEIKRLHRSGDDQALLSFYQSRRAELNTHIDPEVLLLVGLALHRAGRYPESVSLLEQIKTYDLGQVSKGQRMVALVTGLLQSGKKDRALALLEKTEERTLYPATDRQKLDLLLADLYQDQGRLRESLSLYRNLVREERLLADREIARIYLEMGRISSRMGNYEEARASLNRCIGILEPLKEKDPLLCAAHVEIGKAYYGETLYEKALDSYARALETGFSPEDPGYWELRFHMALAYLETKQYDQAEPLLTEISEQGDGLLQQRVRIRLGMLGLEKQLQRLSIGSKGVR